MGTLRACSGKLTSFAPRPSMLGKRVHDKVKTVRTCEVNDEPTGFDPPKGALIRNDDVA